MWPLLLLACAPWSDTDLDGDGYDAVVDGGTDCDDGDAQVHPAALDPVGDGRDDNCDDVDGVDGDRDGVASVGSGGEDCDDTDALVNPDAVERCNGLDDDCEGTVDHDAVDALEWFTDVDGDGIGGTELTAACESPGPDQVSVGGDCDDTDPARYPGALEPCGLDLDCDGTSAACPDIAGAQALVFTGRDPAERTGWSVADGGDVTGNGHPDLVVGAPSADRIWLVEGPLPVGGSLDLLAHRTVALSTSGGVSVAGVGDVNDDGFADLLIGASEDGGAGSAWLLPGPVLNGATPTGTAFELLAEGPADEAGRAVSAPGDADGDGLADLLIGAWNHGAGGAAYVVSGDLSGNKVLSDADLKLVTSLPGAGAGWSLAGGDLDGDGLADLFVGGPHQDGGRLWSVPGMSGVGQSSLSLDVDAATLAGSPGDLVGWSVAVGDMDGDGLSDTWVGAPGATGGLGCAWLVLGTESPQPGTADVASVAVASVCGGVSGERMGESLVMVPDMDLDGIPEIAVAGMGAETSLAEDGAVWLFQGVLSGSHGPADAAATWTGDQSSDALGAGLSAGDWNQDGRGDVLIGAPGHGIDGYGPGAALLFYGG